LTTTHTFPNKSIDEILKAGVNVVDGNRVTVSYTDKTFKAIKQYTVPLFTIGNIEYDLSAAIIDATSVKTTLIITNSERGVIFQPPYKDLYDLYYSRMEYLLYDNKPWLTCADPSFINASYFTHFALCDGEENNIPEKQSRK